MHTLFSTLLLALAAGTVQAQTTYIRQNNTNLLNTAGAWSPSGPPSSSDTVKWDNTDSANLSTALGGNSTWGQILFSNNVANTITIGNTASSALTLNGINGIGIDMSLANKDLTISDPITLGASQTWMVTNGRTLTIGYPIGDGGNGYGITITNYLSGGTVTLTGTNTFSGPVIIATNCTLSVAVISNGLSASGLGQSSASATNLVFGKGAALTYTGSGSAISDRSFTMNGNLTISGSGSGANGALQLTNTAGIAFGTPNQACTLSLSGAGNLAITNILAAAITNNGSGVVSLTDGGSSLGTVWWLKGSNSFTGGLLFNRGFLMFSSGALGTNGTIGIGANAGFPYDLGLIWAPGCSDDLSANGRFNSTGSSGWASLDTGTNNVVFANGITLAGGSTIIKNGTGSLTLNAASSWGSSGGATLINAGTLVANVLANGFTASSIGSISNSATYLGLRGGTLKYIGTGSTNNHNFYIGASSAIDASGSGPLVFSNTAAVSPTALATTVGITSGSPTTGNFPRNAVDLVPGMVVGGVGIPPNTTLVSIGVNSTLTLSKNATNTTTTTLTFGSYAASTLTLMGTNTAGNEIKGILQDSVSGVDASTTPLSITKTGVGQWILSGTNTYSGATTISNGTLTVNGSLTPASAMTISGGTLAGKGTVQGVITNNGTIAPGGASTIGTFTLTNLLTGSGAIIFDLTNANTAGVTYDQINGGGTLQVALSGSTMIQVNPLTGNFTNGTYYLITNTASLTGGQFVLTNGLTSMTVGASVLTLTNSSTGLILNVGATPPTQLAFTALPATPQIGVPFSVTVVAQDAGGNLDVVTADTTVALSRGSGSGTLSGTLSGVIVSNSSSVTISGVQYDTAETMTLNATTTNGMSLTAVNTNITFTPVPTKLAITSVNGGSSPTAGTGFNVVVQSQDGASTPRTVVSNTLVSLSLNTGTGTLNLPLTSTILAGTSSATITNVIYNKGETGVVLTASRTIGDNLTAGNSTPFNVLSNSAKSILAFSILGYSGAIVGTNITVTLPPYTVVTNLTPTYTVSIYATGSPASGVARNFTTNQTYIITAQDGSQQIYLASVTVMTANAFNWTNTVSGNWSSVINWTNNFSWPGAPTNTGDATYALNFNKASTNIVTATNDLNNGFLLNQLNFAGPTLTLAGNSLTFTNNGTALPQVNQNSNVTVTINNSLAVGADLTVGGTGSGQIVLANQISGTGELIKNTTGALTLNYGTNTYSGGTTVNAGSLSFGITANNVLGTGLITMNSGTTLNPNAGTITNAMVLNNATVANGNSFSANLNGSITLTGTNSFNLATTGNMAIGGNVSGSGGITKLGTSAGGFSITGSNTFSGSVAINAGNLTVASINSVSGGQPTSNLGAPTNAAGGTISLGSTTTAGNLIYTGPGETTDRIMQLSGTTGGGTITQQGTAAGLSVTQTGQSGLLKFTSNLSVPGVAGQDNRKTLTLTNSVNANTGRLPGAGELAGNIGDSVLGTVGQLAASIAKSGPGIWTLSGTNTYTGTTWVQAGTLICTKAVSLGSGSLDITNGTAKLQLDFLGTRQVALLTLNGVSQPNGTYGSSSSLATTKDDTHFAGLGTVTVGSISGATTNTILLTSGSNPSSFGTSLTFTATITGGATPSGNVVFYDGLMAIATNALNGSFQAAFSISSLTGGVHSLTALYLGNSSNAPSASATLMQTVNDSRPATTTTIAQTSGSNPSGLGAAVGFTATVTGTTPTGTVLFLDGSSVIGSIALNGSFQASLTNSSLTSGWHGIMAQYQGDANNAPSTSAATWQTIKPSTGNGKLKVFILAGQSNMQGKGSVEQGRDPNNLNLGSDPNNLSIVGGLGSLRNMVNSNPNKYGYLLDTNPVANTTNTIVPGWRTLTNTWVSYFTSGSTASATEARKGYLDASFGLNSNDGHIGPEYGFGLVVGSQLGDPVLIIKTAWGGNSLAWNFRPPSSGTTILTNVNTMRDAYSNMIANVVYVLNNLTNELTNFSYNPVAGYEIVGFGWHQGWNDRIVANATAEYETNMVNFIHDVRTNLGVPNLPFVIATTGMANCDSDPLGLSVCSKQAAMANPVLHPELGGQVLTIDARPFDYGQAMGLNSEGFHWYFNGRSQFEIGQSMGFGMMQLLSAQASVTNTPASAITTNAAALNAGVVWPFTPCTGVVYWDTTDHGTNGGWANSAVVNAWTNSIVTNQYGVAGDYILAGGSLVTLAATNLSYTATGLNTNTTYYFTFSATNLTVSDFGLTNAQILWAPSSQSFTTLSVSVGTPPTPVLPGNAIVVTGGTPGFTFNTVSGYKYRIVFKNTLTDASWSAVIAPPNYPAPDGWSAVSSGSPISLTDTNIVGQPQRFYRIEVANP